MSNLRIYNTHIFTLDELAEGVMKQITANLPPGITIKKFNWTMTLNDTMPTTLAGPRNKALAYKEGDDPKRRVIGWEGYYHIEFSGPVEDDPLEYTAFSCLHPGALNDEQSDIKEVRACRIFADDFPTIAVSALISNDDRYAPQTFAYESFY
jgi:hypothetical protein